jgi:hypothetical protein
MQVDQSGIIGFLLAMKTLTLCLCNRSRRRTKYQLLFCHACVSLYAIDCGQPQIALAYFENTFTDPPLIQTLSFLSRTFKLEEPIASAQHPSRYHLLLRFIETKQLK